ncbi:hypothetical protein PoB_001036300 [Plakobranchus ocellatus]|uniref:Uncharacterized protein n=1 Tax=Plakobranchus ocellatus TaxID=259542 RepID=A0AAV3YNK5_9GAST|nr:hypothetical protein PoB_001036300 [Plakobranchus ocellatus]
MFPCMYHLFHIKKRFTKVILTFPITGHSYIECEKDTGLVNQQFRAEVPSDWVQFFERAQRSPHPFTVIPCDSAVFRNLSHHLDPLFLAKCSLVSRPLREIKSLKESPSVMKFRELWNGLLSTVLSQNESPPKKTTDTECSKKIV